jgi:hypothetical protein
VSQPVLVYTVWTGSTPNSSPANTLSFSAWAQDRAAMKETE